MIKGMLFAIATAFLFACAQATENGSNGGEIKAPFMPMVKVKGGEYTVGKKTLDPENKITVDTFMIGMYEVSQGQWESVMGIEWPGIGQKEEGDMNKGEFKIPTISYGKSSKHPAYYVSFYDTVRFCNMLSEKEELEPVYYIGEKYTKENAALITNADKDFNAHSIKIDMSKNGYRLPTEEEWEYTAGGGESNRTDYSGTDNGTSKGVKPLTAYAWYRDNSDFVSHETGLKEANILGVYDMTGNLWEWCYVSARDDITNAPIRGGSYMHNNNYLQVTFKGAEKFENRHLRIGFRVARNIIDNM